MQDGGPTQLKPTTDRARNPVPIRIGLLLFDIAYVRATRTTKTEWLMADSSVNRQHIPLTAAFDSTLRASVNLSSGVHLES